MQKRVILVMEKYIIEPLGVQHLLSIAKMLGWDAQVFLHENFDFAPLFEEANGVDIVGFSLWTGAHQPVFRAADKLREQGISVVIGGPHATYYTEECAKHADWVAKGESFRIWRHILRSFNTRRILPAGVKRIDSKVFFDENAKAEKFPLPNLGREVVYHRYPDLANSPIKSIMGSIGCPFHCTYCNSPHFNEMYGGFRNVFRVRLIDDIIAEALYVRDNWGVKTFYFQDDIFGYNIKWLETFVQRWKREVGVPWHCQIRLELTRGKPGKKRLDLFIEGGCSGITLAIESGSAFLREYVLLRPMRHELIVEGCRRIMEQGLTLRTEQILQVPFSNLTTDLSTLKLNCEINPTMAWSSILKPFGETNIGKIARCWGFWEKDAVSSIYWDSSPLRHSDTAMEVIRPHVESLRSTNQRFNSPLLHMYVKPSGDSRGWVFLEDDLVVLDPKKRLCEIEYLSLEENKRYCDQISHLQPIFNWLAKVPQGHRLGRKWVELEKRDWTFENLGKLTEAHLREIGYGDVAEKWKREFAHQFGCSLEELPKGVKANPLYFCFFPSGPKLARTMIEKQIFSLPPETFWRELGDTAKKHLFSHGLFRTANDIKEPIARCS